MKRGMFILLLISTIFLTSCSSRNLYELPKDASINIKEDSIEVFDKVKLYSLIKNTNMELITDDTDLETDVIGEHTYTLDLKYNKKKYKYDLKYKVIDVTPPSFIQASSSRSTLLTQVIDPCESIVYGDDYDTKPTCEIIGNVDYTKLGSYKVKYQLKDSSNK